MEDLGLVFRKKSCPGKDGHPPSQVNLLGSVYVRKKETPLPQLTVLVHALIVCRL